MIEEYFHIRDNCRNGLIKYLQEALSVLPVIKNPEILDIGCGTGVPALWLAGKYAGRITAIDIDRDSLGWLQKKIDEKILGDRITVLNLSFFDFKTQPDYYDLILSEGFLNVVGFKKGFQRAINILKKKGFFIIHDEFKDHPWKCNFIRDNGCGIIDTLFLDEQVWWNDYYKKLESAINDLADIRLKSLFKMDLKELKQYKYDPSLFKSIYYIVEKL